MTDRPLAFPSGGPLVKLRTVNGTKATGMLFRRKKAPLPREYLVTDLRDLRTYWIAAPTPREALIERENLWRRTPLPSSSRAVDYSSGNSIDMTLGESAIRGLRKNVIREVDERETEPG